MGVVNQLTTKHDEGSTGKFLSSCMKRATGLIGTRKHHGYTSLHGVLSCLPSVQHLLGIRGIPKIL